MQSDFKIVEEKEENGLIYQRVRYYEGSTTTEDEEDINGTLVPVNRYRRSALIEEVEYWYE